MRVLIMMVMMVMSFGDHDYDDDYDDMLMLGFDVKMSRQAQLP